MKKRAVVLLSICLCAVLMVGIFSIRSRSAMIGTIKGAEMERIVIDDTTYYLNNDLDFSNKDKGSFLGWVTAGEMKWRVYSVKGDTEGKYLYRLWDWEGAFYERED